jgi:hypothetical protein
MGKSPAPAAALGSANPKYFCKLVLILIKQRSYKNTIEQSVQSVPCKPLWLIFLTKGIGSNGNFATTLPSNIEFMSPNTTIKTTSTTPPDLNFARDRSRVDSLREVSTRSSFFELGADLFEGNLSISSFFDAR